MTALDPSSRVIRLLLDGEGDRVDLGVPSDEVAAGDFDLDIFDLAPPYPSGSLTLPPLAGSPPDPAEVLLRSALEANLTTLF